MLINVNMNFFVGLSIQLNQINSQKASLFQVEDSTKCPYPKFQRSGTIRNSCHFSMQKNISMRMRIGVEMVSCARRYISRASGWILKILTAFGS